MSLESWRSALADALNGMPGLRCGDPYMTDQVNPPQAMIDIDDIAYDLTFARGADVYQFTVLVFDQRTSVRATQRRFDTWRDGTDPKSVKHVVENDSGVAAECDYTRIVSVSAPTSVSVGNVDYMLLEFQGEVVL